MEIIGIILLTWFSIGLYRYAKHHDKERAEHFRHSGEVLRAMTKEESREYIKNIRERKTVANWAIFEKVEKRLSGK